MLYPLFTMVMLIIIVAVAAFIFRYKSIQSGEIQIKYFRLLEGQEVSDKIKQSTNCYSNMFEVPMLFLVAGSLSMVLELESQTILSLVWAFVVFRCLHAVVLMSYNNVLHRMLCFWAALFCMLGMWIQLLLHYHSTVAN